ncbi:MAG: hypothetical protein A2W98_05195 [Bacteroidetes bacterium GWF2_33_38]|nr:MAG: hypothetical protein A2W98_05195 [Bacteroidetes bacterium GWF2_33_38]OFY68157.1 MAG: hypothetical protein A2265_06820 [Bacteroidetes bacterium RIFOXYA12_FULL_33_9]OFY86864.1 MAG: hypothetical protein A2236_12520 [Bacteroidetes bacterium RIFOXYA2_FULL_33_7]
MLLLFSSVTSYAQTTQCGIYKTVDDFKNQQISIHGNCEFGKKAVQISDFFLRPYIYIKTEKGKIKTLQDSIYAVKDCAGNVYRIWHQKPYQLIEKGVFNIYSYKYLGTIKKRTSRSVRFEHKEMTAYYFSVDDSSEIFLLTLTNVRLALLTDKDLDNNLLKTFPDNQSLWSITNKQFNINSFLNNLKNK